MSQLSQISGPKEKKTGIIHKQSLKRDDTGNLTFCDNYWFCRKFCFGSKIRRNGQESLFWESLYLAQRRHLYAESAGSDPENSDSGGRETCQLYGFLLFCCRNWTNNTKINRKKGGVEAPPRPSSKSALGPYGVLQSWHPDGYSTASSISRILSIPNLDSIFPFPAPQYSPFKYLSLWLLNPQSLPSNEVSPGYQKTYWRLSSIKVVTLSSSSLNSKLHSIIKRKKWNFTIRALRISQHKALVE